jgi:hypothetical protein
MEVTVRTGLLCVLHDPFLQAEVLVDAADAGVAAGIGHSHRRQAGEEDEAAHLCNRKKGAAADAHFQLSLRCKHKRIL